MFSKKKPERPKRARDGNLSQYGLFDIPTELSLDDGNEEDGGDSDLDAELLALTQDGGAKPKRPARKRPQPTANLDAMVQESLRDIPSDEEISGDDDDPELLNELNDIAGDEATELASEPSPTKQTHPSDITALLQERYKMYELAEANAKAAGETSRARRFGRGLKTVKDLLKQASAGRSINPDDIPPEVTVNVQKREQANDTTGDAQAEVPVAVSRPAPPPPTSDTSVCESTSAATPVNHELLDMLNKRKEEYKLAALEAKRGGEVATAVAHVKIAKQFEMVIKAVEAGQEVDLSRMPGPPVKASQAVEECQSQGKEAEEETPQPVVPVPDTAEDDEPAVLITANSLAEALQQRLEVYKNQEQAAKEQGNSSKARRMGRIVKQFEQAVKLEKQGKPIPAEDLPTPPGYAPLPGYEKPPEPVAVPSPRPAPPTPSTPSEQPVTTPPKTNDEPISPQRVKRPSAKHPPTTRAEKQIALLTARQREFKEAALEAKKKGEIAQAKEFLKTAKGFDPLIEASQGGLPVDIASLPIPPSAKSQLDNEYEMIMAEECTEDDTGVLDVMSRLESQLTKQLKMCLTTRDHHKALGDVAGTNRFEHLALSVTKDLDLVRMAKRTSCASAPMFHYETRDFSIVKSFTELNDNDLELSILRGINFNCSNPKDIDTYVKFEFPYPQEQPYCDKTSTVKDTNNPDFNANFMIPIQRTSKPCLRTFKRHSVKFEVYSKGCFASDWGCCFSGFFRSDALLGTINVKLQPLETQCELHDSFDLMEGRKKVGGKLEIRLRVRDPLISKEVQRLSERWLVIDR